jgi:alpha 1,3-glucosidase
MKKLLIQSLITFISINLIFAFDSHKFDKCDQIGFCNRMRKEEQSFYELKDIKAKDDEIFGILKDEKNKYNDPLEFSIKGYENGIFRLTIKEVENKDIKKKRYEVKDVVLETVKQSKFEYNNNILKFGETEIKIESSPFSLKFFSKGYEVLEFNSKNLLKVESIYREKIQKNETEGIEGYGKFNLNIKDGESALGFDFKFSKSKNLFGIPERTTDLLLKPTKGDGISSEPYRMYNLDVYRYDLNSPLGNKNNNI